MVTTKMSPDINKCPLGDTLPQLTATALDNVGPLRLPEDLAREQSTQIFSSH